MGGSARAEGARIVCIVALGALALAVNHFLVNWILYTDAYLRWFLY
jgi:hypothetical protein